MEMYTFQTSITHEMFLINLFNKNRILSDESNAIFYKENNFSNVLQYFVEREIIKAISRCKNEEFSLKQDKKKEVYEKMEQRIREIQKETNKIDEEETKDQFMEPSNLNAIQLTIVDNQILKPKRTKT